MNNRASYKPPVSFLYKFSSPLFLLIMLGVYLECTFLLGFSLIPSVAIFIYFSKWTLLSPLWIRIFGIAFSLGFGFFAFGLTLLFAVPLISRLFGLHSSKGKYSFYTFEGIRWLLYMANLQLVRNTFMNFVLATPLLNLFFRMMGATIGKKVFISTNTITDCNLVTIGDHSLIGGYAIITCHSAEGNVLIVEPIKIGKRVTIGINAVIFPGVTIGDGATIAANSVVPKGMKIPPDTIWGGVPIKQILTGNREDKHFFS